VDRHYSPGVEPVPSFLPHNGGTNFQRPGIADAGLTDKVDVSLTGTTSPLVLSDAQALRCMVLKLTGTHPGGTYEVHCPTNKKIYVVWNGTAGDVTFKTVAGTGIVVNAGAVLILYCDGTDVIQLAGLVATIDDIGDVVVTADGQALYPRASEALPHGSGDRA
jgi:hypothetical protein